MALSKTIDTVTQKIYKRSLPTREIYLDHIAKARGKSPKSEFFEVCLSEPHGFAACCQIDKEYFKCNIVENIGIIARYDDIVSAHQLISSSAHQLISSSAHQLISSSAHQLISSSAHQLISSSAHQLISSSAHQLISSSAHQLISLLSLFLI